MTRVLRSQGRERAGEHGSDRASLAGASRRRFGPYRLLERLGHGGMGQVYKAEHRLMKRVVALKLLGRVGPGQCESLPMRRLRGEIEAVGSLQHPNIVTAFDAGVWHGQLYLAMEYLKGIDLQRLVDKTGPLTVDLACEIIRQAAEALQHAHDRGLVHRDIKPANLMLTPPGVTVKLLDLGLAQWTNRIGPSAEEDNPEGSLCGTPDFMAPERGHAPCSVDSRGDLYSLGCTFYYLLTGQVPYPGGSWTEKLLRHNLDVPLPLQRCRTDVPEAITAILARLMSRDVEERYPTAAAVAEALRAATDVLASRPQDPLQKVGRPAPMRPGRFRRALRLCGSAFVAILLGVAAAGGARKMVTPPQLVPALAALRQEVPFTIEGCSTGFASLAQAIAAAQDGDVLTIHTADPFHLSPLRWEGKALTLRAANGIHPRLIMKAADEPCQALLETDRGLRIDGITLERSETSSSVQDSLVGPLIRSAQSPLYLRKCRLITANGGAAVVARNPSELVLQGCTIMADSVGVSVEVGQGTATRIRAVDNRVTIRGEAGVAFSLWAMSGRRPCPLVLEWEGNTLAASRITALHALPSTPSIIARSNRFLYRSALLSYSGFADADAWRGTRWQGSGNTFEGPSSCLTVENTPVSPSAHPRLD